VKKKVIKSIYKDFLGVSKNFTNKIVDSCSEHMREFICFDSASKF